MKAALLIVLVALAATGARADRGAPRPAARIAAVGDDTPATRLFRAEFIVTNPRRNCTLFAGAGASAYSNGLLNVWQALFKATGVDANITNSAAVCIDPPPEQRGKMLIRTTLRTTPLNSTTIQELYYDYLALEEQYTTTKAVVLEDSGEKWVPEYFEYKPRRILAVCLPGIKGFRCSGRPWDPLNTRAIYFRAYPK